MKIIYRRPEIEDKERETHTPIQNDTKQTFKDQTIRALCRSLLSSNIHPLFVSPICKRVGRRAGAERGKQTLVLWRIFGGIGIKNARK